MEVPPYGSSKIYLLHSFSGIKVWWKSSTRKKVHGWIRSPIQHPMVQCTMKIVTRFQFMVGSAIQHSTKIVP